MILLLQWFLHQKSNPDTVKEEATKVAKHRAGKPSLACKREPNCFVKA